MPWSAPTQSGVLVALTVAMGSSKARMGGGVGSAVGAVAADDWAAGGGPGAVPERPGDAPGVEQASSANASPIDSQRPTRTTGSLLSDAGPPAARRWGRGTNPPHGPLPRREGGEGRAAGPLTPGKAVSSASQIWGENASRARAMGCVHYTRRRIRNRAWRGVAYPCRAARRSGAGPRAVSGARGGGARGRARRPAPGRARRGRRYRPRARWARRRARWRRGRGQKTAG